MAPGGSSFSSAVSSAVRGASGGSSGMPADDLDSYVAQMLLKEAQERKEKWNDVGTSAYLSDDEDATKPARRTNKRFLVNLVKNVDDHNQALLRQEQADADVRKKSQIRPQAGRSLFAMAKSGMGSASDPRDMRRTEEKPRRRPESERRDRLRSVDDAGSSRPSRKTTRSPSLDSEADRESRRRRRRLSRDDSVDSRDRHSSRRHREREDYDERSSRRSHRRDDSPERRRSRRYDSDDEAESSRVKHSRHRASKAPENEDDRERSRRRFDSRERRDERHRRKRRHADSADVSSDEDRKDRKSSRRHRSRSPEAHSSKQSAKSRGKERARSRSASPAAPPPDMLPAHGASHAGPSKMDKYFSNDYDPRLDVNLDTLTDPSTGLIAEGNFDEWSAMLDILKIRRQEKNYLAAEKELKAREARHKSKETKPSKSTSSTGTTYAEGQKAILSIGGYAKTKKSTEWGAGPDLSF